MSEAPTTAKRFSIHEQDLAELERLLPRWADQLTMRPNCPPVLRVQFRRLQEIITNVRWGYGPPSEVTVIPADQSTGSGGSPSSS